jgi:alkanesulfonate monooxygenase SsuD/methylene tetrahydromethanopterin reductase-like flavin-dependent oxidoreductase (luciferase family)
VKFTWFNLMPWPDLPADFRDKHRSVWVDIPSTLFDPERANTLYNEYMDQLEYADAVGFDGIGVNEHHQNGYGIMPSPNIIAAGLARRTSRAALCVIGNSIALYNPPIRVAEEFAMLDCISGGRLVAGFPVGTPMDTNFCYGQIPALTRDKYYEAHDLIMKAWAAEEPFAFDGKYNQLRYVNCWPKPIQRPHPPVYIPGGGSIETWDFCLDHDYNYSYLSFAGYKMGKALLDGYWDRVAARGKDDSPYRAAFAQIIAVADTDAEAEKLYAEHILYFYNRCLHVYPGFADPPGYRTISTIKAGVLDQLRVENQRTFATVTWKDLVEGGYVIAGSPATVHDRMVDMIRDLRIGHVFCLLHNGDQPDWKTRYSTKLFADKVMPRLRDVWPDHADDDRWWIKPLAGRVQPDVTMADARRDATIPDGALDR